MTDFNCKRQVGDTGDGSDEPLSLRLIHRLPSLLQAVLLVFFKLAAADDGCNLSLGSWRWANRVEIPGLRRIAGKDRGIGPSWGVVCEWAWSAMAIDWRVCQWSCRSRLVSLSKWRNRRLGQSHSLIAARNSVRFQNSSFAIVSC
jgi:hypothetical protein